MKKYILFSISALMTSTVNADVYAKYNSSKASEYAYNNAYIPYKNISNSEHYNQFADYKYYGGNCTNFVSQSILGGLVGTNKTYKAYNKKSLFDIDRYSTGYQWFYIYNSNRSGYGQGRGSAWTKSEALKTYAQNNIPENRGLHFEYITHDTPTVAMKYNKVKVGDVIFADWTTDGVRDHSMIVTKINPSNYGYNKIYVTYQNGVDPTTGEVYPIRRNYSLGKLNKKTNYKAQFVVFRPLDYNPYGI